VNEPTEAELALAKELLAIGAPAASEVISAGRVMCAEWDNASPANRAGLLAVARHVLANFTRLPASAPSAPSALNNSEPKGHA
jgi:hypothetical protein